MRKHKLPAVGDKKGDLAIMEIILAVPGSGGDARLVCNCKCGSTGFLVDLRKFRSGHTTSCGCGRRRRNGLSTTSEFRTWSGMMRRCYNKEEKSYKSYGGRGIIVCDRWHDFFLFLEDVGKKPTTRHSLGRRNNNGHYEPSNCSWETQLEQNNNKRTNRLIEFRGVTKSASQWSVITGIKRNTIVFRLNSGWSANDILTKPVRVW